MLKSNCTNINFLIKNLALVSLAIGIVITTSIVFCIFYYSNRGFELTDETFFLYLSNRTGFSDYTTSYFGVLNKLVCFGNPSLINLRIAKIILQLLSLGFFLFGLIKYLRNKNVVFTTIQLSSVVLIIVLTSFAHYDYLPFTLAYNSWSLILGLFIMGFIFIEFASKSKLIQIISSLFVGLLCFCLFLSKLPNGIVLMCIYGFFNIFYIKKNTVIKIGGFVLGCYIAFLIVINNYANLLAVIENYRITLFDVKHAEANLYLMQLYKIGITCSKHKLLTFCVLISLILGGIFTILLLNKIKKGNSQNKNLYILLISTVGLLGWMPFFKGNGNGFFTFSNFVSGSLFLINPIVFIYLHKSISIKISNFFKNEIYILWLILFFMPVFLMLGSNNAFFYSIPPTMVFAFTAVIIYIVKSKVDTSIYLSVYTLFITFFIGSIFYFGAIKKPYRQSDLRKKTYLLPFKNNSLKNIYESKEHFIDYVTVSTAISKLNDGNKPFLTFYEFFGFKIMNNLETMPKLALSSQERMLEYNDFVMKDINVIKDKPLLLIPDTIINNQKYISQFNKHGIYFHKNYKLMLKYSFKSSIQVVNIFKYND